MGRLDHASTTCIGAVDAIPFLAYAVLIAASGAAAAGVAATDQRECDRGAATATAAGETAGIQQAAAAAAPNAHGSRMLEQKLSCTLVAALRYVQASAALEGSAEAAMHLEGSAEAAMHLLHLLQRD